MKDLQPLNIELTEEAAEEYARLECIGQYGLWLTGLDGAAGVEYAELTAEEGARLRYLGSPYRDWPEDITPAEYYENAAEELNIYARRAGYANARAASAALKPAYEARQQAIADARYEAALKRSEAAKRAAATRKSLKAMRAQLEAAREQDLAAVEVEAAPVAEEEEATPAASTRIELSEEEATAAGDPWAITYTASAKGQTHAEAYYRVVIAQLRLARAFELSNPDDWYDGDTAITSAALAIWENRLDRLRSGEGRADYETSRRLTYRSIVADYPALVRQIHARLTREPRHTRAQCLLWFASSPWADSVTVAAIVLVIDHLLTK